MHPHALGMRYTDAQLLAAAKLLSRKQVWTRDRRLSTARSSKIGAGRKLAFTHFTPASTLHLILHTH